MGKPGNITAYSSASRAVVGLVLLSIAGCLTVMTAPARACAALPVPPPDEKPYGPQPMGAPAATARYAANLKKFEGNADVLVLPGLVADRKARRVEVMAEGTGLKAREPVEFLLIDQGSSHGYEALLWSLARPSDVHRALEFIGLHRGAPFNPAALRFWADGDRVKVSVREKDGQAAVPIERLVLDTETDKTLPEDGFVFAGSMAVQPSQTEGSSSYAADIHDPRSVASLYNEPTAVLDVPRRANQGEVYGKQVVNPETGFEGGKLLTVILEPGAPDGQSRAKVFELSFGRGAQATGVVCRLTERGVAGRGEALDLAPALERLAGLREKGGPPRVSISLDRELPVGEAARVCTVMVLVEATGIARIEPPVDGQLYYRAFVPDKSWRQAEGRPSQPWELHLRQGDGKVTGELAWNEALEDDGGALPAFRRKTRPAPNPAAVRAALDADAREREKSGKASLPGVLLVYAAASMPCGEVVAFVQPALKTHGTIYVFAGPSVE
jgi:hypothetical protein